MRDPSADPLADPPPVACVTTGDPCGTVDFYGVCTGDVLAFCSQALIVRDCASAYASCDWESEQVGYNCLTPCELADPPVSAAGRCIGGAIQRCTFADGAFSVQLEPCPPGRSCAVYDETSSPSCLPDPPCAGLGPEGACDGSERLSCVDGVTSGVDCAATGEVCAYGGAAGYVCAPPGATGTHSVRGQLRYEDRVPGLDGLGDLVEVPARGFAVAIVAVADGAVLAVGATDDDGGYALRFDRADPVYVVFATASDTPEQPVRVIRPDGTLHSAATASFTPSADRIEDYVLTDVSGSGPAANVYDQLSTSIEVTRAVLGLLEPEPLFAAWTRGGTEGTFFWSGGVFLLSDLWDEDGYDDAVIVHEVGHYALNTYGLSDSVISTHGPSPIDPTSAWSEGFATWFSSYVRADPWYIDTNGYGGLSLDLEQATTLAPDPLGSMSQDLSSDLVSELLWDLGDAPDADDDPSGDVGAADSVLLVATAGLRDLATDRGATGVDLVDFLDAWLVASGGDGCDDLRAVVATYGFPYDFAGPAPCP